MGRVLARTCRRRECPWFPVSRPYYSWLLPPFGPILTYLRSLAPGPFRVQLILQDRFKNRYALWFISEQQSVQILKPIFYFFFRLNIHFFRTSLLFTTKKVPCSPCAGSGPERREDGLLSFRDVKSSSSGQKFHSRWIWVVIFMDDSKKGRFFNPTRNRAGL